MSILKSLTIKNLKLNKKRTIVTIIGIILATALIVALSSLVVSFRASMIEYEKSYSGNYHYKFSNVPKDEIKYIQNNRNVEKTCIVQGVGYAKLDDSKNEYKPYLYLQKFSKESFENLGIKLIEGRLPENDDEIVISNHIKTNGRVKYNIGDTLTLDIGKRISEGNELTQNEMYIKDIEEHLEKEFTKTYKIVGIIERPLDAIESYSAPGYTIITILNENDSYENIDVYVRYTKDGLKNHYKTTASILGIDEQTFKDYDIGRVINIENLKYSYTSNSYLINIENLDFSESIMAMLYSVSAIIIVIIIVTSVFCIRNSFAISITEKVKQYGMLASVGATSKQIKRNVYFESFVLALIGIPLGIALGLLAAFILIQVCNILLKDMVTFELIYKFSWASILISLVLSIVTCLLSARSSAKKASKISPIDAIRESTDIKIKNKKVKSPKFIKKMFGIGGDIAYKNLKRNRKKYRTTVISIVVCVAVFIATSSFVDLAFKSVDLEVAQVDYNILVRKNRNTSPSDIETLKEISTLDNINKYTIQREDGILVNNLPFTEEYKKVNRMISTDEDSYIRLVSVGKDEYNRYINKLGLKYDECKDKGILINKYVTSIADEKGNSKKTEIDRYDIKRGDKIGGYLDINHKDEEYIDIEICSVTKETPMALNSNYVNGAIVVSDEFMDKYKDILKPANISMFIDSSNPDKLQDDIEMYLSTEVDDYYLENINQNMKSMQSLFLLIAIFLYGFITVIALIGITNIFNTITTSMELRSKEFAMLKSVGMTTKEFNRMIKLESLLYGLKSLVIGLPIGMILSYLLYKALMQGIEFAYPIPTNGIVISVIAVFALVWSIMKFSLSKINKQNIIETIRRDNI